MGGFGRLKDYHVREIVCIGSDDFVVEMRTKILNETISILEDLELSSSISIASDPFILPKMQKYKKLQHQESSKLELRLNYSKDEQLSCTSFNLHGTSFSHPFNIEVKGCGETVTGCVGYGIERWVLAFMCQYGLEVNNWPQKIRGNLIMKNIVDVVLMCHEELLKKANIDMQPSLDNQIGSETGIDSLGIVEFVMLLEEELDIELDDKLREIRKCKTFREVVSTIEKI